MKIKLTLTQVEAALLNGFASPLNSKAKVVKESATVKCNGYIAQIEGYTIYALQADFQAAWDELKAEAGRHIVGGTLKIFAAYIRNGCASVTNHTPVKTLNYNG